MKVRILKLVMISELSFSGARDGLTSGEDRFVYRGGDDLQDEMTPNTRSSLYVQFVAAKQVPNIAHLQDVQRNPINDHEDLIQREWGWVEVRNALKPKQHQNHRLQQRRVSSK